MPGILNARVGQEKFRFSSIPADARLSAYLAHYWVVEWDLRYQDPYEQHVLPYPSVNMTFTAGRCRVAGVPRGRFSEVLHGKGRVFGARFQPAGFRGFLGASVSSITDRFVPVDSLFGAPGRDLAEAILAADNPTAVKIMDDFLVPRIGEPDPIADTVAAIVDRAANDSTIIRVDQLATEFQIGMRQLQRLFSSHVGVGPKWVIRRYRLHEAAARASAGDDLDLVQLSIDLGYSDQAHLTRDFTSIVGVSPGRYANAQ